MKIRKATIKDFEQIKKNRAEFYLGETEIDELSDPDWVKFGMGIATAKALRSKNHVFFVAEDKGSIVGYCSGQIEKTPTWIKHKKRGHLYNLFLKKKYRGKGTGKKLIISVINWFKKNKISWIMVLAYSKNKKAQSIYKKMGFSEYIINFNKILK